MNRLRFLHIPKTAGATLRVILVRKFHGRRYFSFTGDTPSDLRRYVSLSEQEKQEIELFLGHIVLSTGIEEVDRATTLTLLREPVSRVKSLCEYASEGKVKGVPPGPFDLDLFLSSKNHQISNQQTRFLINHVSDASPHPLNSLSPADARDLALEKLFHVIARFGIQDYFDESLMLFCQYLNWKMPYYLTLNKRNPRRLLEFKQSHLDQIAELNAIDIEVYNAARKKFLEILASGELDTAKLKRFKFINPRISPLLKIKARLRPLKRYS